MKKILADRIPSSGDIWLVFAFAALFVYGRMLFVFTWKIPAWLKLMTVEEILPILAYALMFSLFEAIAIVLALAVIAFILPPTWFRNSFGAIGVWVVFIYGLSLSVLFAMQAVLINNIAVILVWWTVGTVVLALLAAFAVLRLRFLRTAALWIADRAIIFLYIFVPASLACLIVVIIRNLF